MNKESIKIDTDKLGIVFPAYYMRMPGMFERFIGKLTNLKNTYIFSIVTVGGISGRVLDRFSEAISMRDGKLAAGFVVRMPANYIDSADAMPLFLQRRMFHKWRKKADKIADYVRNGRSGLKEKFNPLMTRLFSKSIDKQYLIGGLSPDIDKNFWADDKCDGCGNCVKICPVQNIKMVNEKPVWQHHCEKCLACIQWCQKQAIQFKNVTMKRKRYHHPDVKILDMLKWKK
jgi:ferredoxin